MSYVKIQQDTMINIADAIRDKLGEDEHYLPSEMPDAIKSIEGGREVLYCMTEMIISVRHSQSNYSSFIDSTTLYAKNTVTSGWNIALDGDRIYAENSVKIYAKKAGKYLTFKIKQKQNTPGTEGEVLEFEINDYQADDLLYKITPPADGYMYTFVAVALDESSGSPAITDITFSEDYSALATTVDGDIREITPTIVDGAITEIDVDGSKVTVEYDENGYLTKVGSVDVDGIGEITPNRLYLYKNGDECTDVTGGWESPTGWSEGIYSGYTITSGQKNNITLHTDASNHYENYVNALVTKNKIDLAPYSKLVVAIISGLNIGAKNSCLMVGIPQEKAFNYAFEAGADTVYTHDISARNNERYINIVSQNGRNAIVSEIYLEK